MSQLLLYKEPQKKTNISVDYLFQKNFAKSVVFEPGSYRLHFAWIDKNNYRPFFKGKEVEFYCLGLLYVDGDRIDRKWEQLEKIWFGQGLSGFDKLDGHGNLLIYDSRRNIWYVITPRMGFMPVFYGKSTTGDRIAVGTNTDQIAEYLVDNELDRVAIAEFISTTCITAPHTYYKNIKQMESASIYRFDGEKVTQVEEYWKPDLEHNHFADYRESARLISDFIKTSVNKKVRNNNSKGLLMLSGGLDSRMSLFAADDPPKMMDAVTFYTEENTELKLASKLAEKAEVPHHPLKREYEYYGKLALEGIRTVGGMYNFLTLHASGFNEELWELNQGVLLSGNYFDTFFKGFAFEKKDAYKKLTGSMYKEYRDQTSFWDTWGFLELDEHWKKRVEQRREDYYGFERIKEEALTPQILNRIKFSRIKNMARIRGGGMDHDLYKSNFYDLVISDINFSKVFEFLNPFHEVDKKFIDALLNNISKEMTSVVNSNFLTSHLTWNNYYITAFLNAFMKRFHNIIPPRQKKSIAKGSSWIDWDVYRRDSKILKGYWKECGEHEQSVTVLREILGYNPYALDHNHSKFHHQDFLNLLTMGLWIKYCCRAD